MVWDSAGHKKKGLAILVTALLIAGSFVVFFNIEADTDLSIPRANNNPELGTENTYQVRLQIDDEERIPIEHVSLIWQHVNQSSKELEIAKEVRWRPSCDGDDNDGLKVVKGYKKGVDAAAGECKVLIGGATKGANDETYTVTDALGYGYLLVKGTGYGYADLGGEEDNLQGGYGYKCNSHIVRKKGEHVCLDNKVDQEGTTSSRASNPLDSYFVLTDMEADEGEEAGTSNEADCDPSNLPGDPANDCFGYGNGYGYNFQGKAQDVVLEWTVPVTLSSENFTTSKEYDLVAVVWTGSQVLRTLQTNQDSFTITPKTASDGGGDTPDDDEQDGGTPSQTFSVNAGTCSPSCTVTIPSGVKSGDTVRVHFSSSDDLFAFLEFQADADIGSQVEIERFDPGNRPDGVPDPGDTIDPRYYFNLSVTSGGQSIADDISNFNLLWKLRHEWLNGTLQGHERDLAYPDSAIQLGHFEGVHGDHDHEHAWEAESTSRETSALPSGADTATYAFYNSSFDLTSTFSAGAFDDTGPTFSGESPTGTIENRRPTISVDVSDSGVGVNGDSITMMLDGQTVQHSFSDGTVSFKPSSNLAFDQHSVSVSAEDEFGNEGNTSWTFTVEEVVDSVKPEITNLQPAPDSSVGSDATISADYSDDMSGIDLDSVTLTVDGEDVTSDADVTASSISYAPDGGFDSGDHTAELTVSDVAGNQQSQSWSFNVEGLSGLLPIIIGIVAVIVIAAVAAWYLLVYQKQNP